jgi:hypothetical protein
MITGFCDLDQRDGVGQLVGVRARAARGPDPLFKEALGIVEGFGLHVLAKRQRHRTAFERIGQHLHGALQAEMICSGRVMRSK